VDAWGNELPDFEDEFTSEEKVNMNDMIDDDDEREGPLFASLDEIKATCARLLRKGVIVPTGEYRRSPYTGEMAPVYMRNPTLSEEQAKALIESDEPPVVQH
jgi:hypothetical protein